MEARLALAAPSGYFDAINPGFVAAGWALDTDVPSQSIQVQFCIDGNCIDTKPTSLYWQHINNTFNVTGNHGFNWQIPSSYLDGSTHTLRVWALDNASGQRFQLGASPKTFANQLPDGALEGVDVSDFSVHGWAADRDAPADDIPVHLYIDGRFEGQVYANQPRSEAGLPHNHGFSIAIPRKYLDGAAHSIEVYGIDAHGGANKRLYRFVTQFANRLPEGSLEGVDVRDFSVYGWAADRDTPADAIPVHLYIDGRFAGQVYANQPRSISGFSGNHGFSIAIPQQYLDGATHSVEVYGIDPAGGANKSLYRFVSQFANRLPEGSLEGVDTRDFSVYGWAADHDMPADAIPVHLYIDGRFEGQVYANQPRSISGFSGNHGFSIAIPQQYLDGATHSIEVFGIDPAGGANKSLYRFVSQFQNEQPIGVIGGLDGTRLFGHVHDPDAPAESLLVEILVDGETVGTTVADVPRPDVNDAFQISGNHGWEFNLPSTFFTDQRRHVVDVYAIDPATGLGEFLGSTEFEISGIPSLHSLPGAAASIYLDFDGHDSGKRGIYADVITPVYDEDGNPEYFSAFEISNMRAVWEIVSEDFAPYNIDVTTVDPGDFSNGVGLRVAIGGNGSWYKDVVGGLGGLYSFTNRVPNTVFVFSDNLYGYSKYIGEVSSHEAGHAFGLWHQSLYDEQGERIEEYNPGNGSWAPIMGNSSNAPRSTWHNGPNQFSSTTLQDDMAIIGNSLNGFGFRADDHGNDANSATYLGNYAEGLSGDGVIEQTSDVDYFSFSTDGGPFQISLSVPPKVGNLDSVLELRTATGTLITSASPNDSLDATIIDTLAQGNYRLVVRSTGQYGAVGQYHIGSAGYPRLIQIDEPPPASLPLPNHSDPLVYGDLDGDGHVDGHDIDQLRVAINDESTNLFFDLNIDGNVDQGDMTELVENVLGTSSGDANLDRTVNRADLAIVLKNFGRFGDVNWAGGDSDGDARTGLSDLAAVQNNFDTNEYVAASADVVEVLPAIQTPDRAGQILSAPVVRSLKPLQSVRIRNYNRGHESVIAMQPETVDEAFSTFDRHAYTIRHHKVIKATRLGTWLFRLRAEGELARGGLLEPGRKATRSMEYRPSHDQILREPRV